MELSCPKKENNEKLDKVNNRLVKSFMGKSIVELTLHRVEKHLKQCSGFFVVSYHTPNMQEDEEIRRASKLRVELSKLGLKYIPLRCKYTKNDGSVEYEHSFFVLNLETPNFKGLCITLCRACEQKYLLYAENGEAYILDVTGSLKLLSDNANSIDYISEYLLELKRTKEQDKTWLHCLIESLYSSNSFGLNAAHNCGELL